MNTWIATQNCMKPSNIAPKKVQTLEHCYKKPTKPIAIKNRPKSWTTATKKGQKPWTLAKKNSLQ